MAIWCHGCLLSLGYYGYHEQEWGAYVLSLGHYDIEEEDWGAYTQQVATLKHHFMQNLATC